MKRILMVALLSIITGLAADAALVAVSTTSCKQKADAQNNINVCNFNNVTVNIEGGGNVMFGGCNASVSAPISIYQNQQCSSAASG